MNSAIFQIIIQPIYMVLEALYRFFTITTGFNIIQTIILISFMVSAMCLPLYLRADAISEETNEIKKKLEPRLKSIKKNFKGDERQFLLQTYYRQNNYHPIMDLKLSFSLLLQIPFFFGAYSFFKVIDMSPMYIPFIGNNLANPDGMINIGAFTLNALPILMTLVNILAGYIYAKDKSLRENLNLYIMSLIFLVILYNQPSGLVLYWLFNNVFSLLKNILLKIITPQILLKYTGALVLLVLYLGYHSFHFSWDIVVAAIILYLFVRYLRLPEIKFETKNSYMISLLAFFVLTGIFIPSNVIASSPVEFFSDVTHPLSILKYPIYNAFGIFILWGGVLWMLADKKAKNILNIFGSLLFFVAIINIFFAAAPKATLLSTLNFAVIDVSFVFNKLADKIIYFAVMLMIIFSVGFLFIKNKFVVVNKIILAMILSGILISGFNVYKICHSVNEYKVAKAEISSKELDKHFHFSKTGKNVLVIFLDRAINSFFPLLLAERPELQEMYSGFTYYPNTVSLYGGTVFGYPPIMGGYEYSPIGMAKSEEIYEVDHNRAISVLPLVFKKAGWNVTTTDCPWFDYKTKFVQPEKVYSENGIDFQPVREKYLEYFLSLYDGADKEFLKSKRNFIYYSIMMSVAGSARTRIYDKGRYLDIIKDPEKRSIELVSNYAELNNLSKLTDFSADNDTLVVLNNDLVHSGYILDFPSYELPRALTKKKKLVKSVYNFDSASLEIYHTFAASILMLGRYFDYLKENGIYDNTRIIIVADHGAGVVNPKVNDKFFNTTTVWYNPLLLIKDFNEKGEVKTSNKFMTNADVPSLAAENIVNNPVNPYTNKPINQQPKQNGVYILKYSDWRPELYFGKKNPIAEKEQFYFVKDDIMKRENWITDIPYSKIKEIEGLK